MKSTKNLIPVEDFNIDTLRKAFLQGRLYIQIEETSPADILSRTREKSIRSILQYVSRISHCTSPSYATTIHRLWEDILHSPQLGPLFFLSRYSSNRGQPNWYRVNAVVTALLEHEVYRKDTYTALQLHMLMEQARTRSLSQGHLHSPTAAHAHGADHQAHQPLLRHEPLPARTRRNDHPPENNPAVNRGSPFTRADTRSFATEISVINKKSK